MTQLYLPIIIISCTLLPRRSPQDRQFITSSAGNKITIYILTEMVSNFSVCNTGILTCEKYSNIVCVSIMTVVYRYSNYRGGDKSLARTTMETS